jgi:uncharacterized protein YbcI
VTGQPPTDAPKAAAPRRPANHRDPGGAAPPGDPALDRPAAGTEMPVGLGAMLDRPGLRPAVDGSVRSAISQAIVQIHAERYGKGATQAKTYAFDDVVVTIMRDVLTPVERTLIDAGQADAVRELRAAFHDAVGDTLATTVEELTGRKVESLMSQIDPASGVALEAFVLAE